MHLLLLFCCIYHKGLKMVTFNAITALCLFITIIQAHDASVIETLINRIEKLEAQGSQQQRHIEQQDKLLHDYENKMVNYENRIHHLESQLSSDSQEPIQTEDDKSFKAKNPTINNGNELNNTEGTNRIPVSRTRRGRHSIVRIKVPNRRVLKRTEHPRLVLAGDEGQVAFHATDDKGITPGIGLNQHLIYEDVHINLGNGFHELHGLFIAPRAGLYLFSTSVMIQTGQGDIVATIKKNGTELASAYANGNGGVPQQGSVTVVTHLNAGDEVWVNSDDRTTTSDYGDRFTSFMGCLLFE